MRHGSEPFQPRPRATGRSQAETAASDGRQATGLGPEGGALSGAAPALAPPKSPKSPPFLIYDRHLFGLFLFAKRVARGLGPRQCAHAAGVSVTSVMRAETKRSVASVAFNRLCRWQGEDPAIFLPR